jgi:1-deoxy-D-xylulose-5-phosphate reductoisomerase
LPTRIAILGSTGSIGRSALEVVRSYPDLFEVVALAARANADLLAQQIEEFRPQHVAVVDEEAAAVIAERCPGPTLYRGQLGLEELAAVPVDTTLCAVVGAVGLKPILNAIDAGNRIALANKEPLVMAGEIIMDRARTHGVEVLPVDSEHNAIFQCLQGHDTSDVLTIHLTASGGPFYGRPRDSLAEVLPEEAANHPTWDMGTKISVDSSTLMNKGLEVVEAMWLFDLPLEKIQVIVHPQSIVHSLVEFTDGSILAHLGITDMRFPIQFALTWPRRVQSPMGRLDLTQMRALTFDAPNFEEFPCLHYALEAAREGGTAPTVLNAANETAVAAFCQHRLGFLQIADVIRETLSACGNADASQLDDVLAMDAEARARASETVQAVGV